MSQNTTPAGTNTTSDDPRQPTPAGVAQQYLAAHLVTATHGTAEAAPTLPAGCLERATSVRFHLQRTTDRSTRESAEKRAWSASSGSRTGMVLSGAATCSAVSARTRSESS